MQQSAAFKMLRTRLKTVPSYSFGGDQVKRTSSGNPYSQILHHIPCGSHISEDGDVNQDAGASNLHNGINFTSRLHQFVQMQRQHRMHAKVQAQSHNSSTSSSKVC
jgi:vacuole morphology and inheritance protein 14